MARSAGEGAEVKEELKAETVRVGQSGRNGIKGGLHGEVPESEIERESGGQSRANAINDREQERHGNLDNKSLR